MGIGFVLNTVADSIVKGNWTLVLIVLAVLLVAVLIAAGFGGGNFNIPGEYICGFLAVLACIVLVKLAKNDDVQHPERFVGHSYQLRGSFLEASASEAGMWNYETETIKAKHDFGFTGRASQNNYMRFGIVNLAELPGGKLAKSSDYSHSTRLRVIAGARGATEAPLVEAAVENNNYANKMFWLPARLLVGRYCTRTK